MIMNNRMDEYAPVEQSIPEAPPSQARPIVPAEVGQYLALARNWAIRNPVPCLAAAFVAGVTLAWIIKRK
jgi:hypothetical protein